MRSEEARSC